MPLFKAAEQKPDIDEERLYVGKLPYNISKRELIEMFSLYGLIRLIEIKHGGYAFVEFEDPKNAWGALVLNNTVIDGRKITVEFSNKKQANACFLCSDSGHWAR
jgi:RNA recognition motif-containing protein